MTVAMPSIVRSTEPTTCAVNSTPARARQPVLEELRDLRPVRGDQTLTNHGEFPADVGVGCDVAIGSAAIGLQSCPGGGSRW
jgi:hypothetical protein